METELYTIHSRSDGLSSDVRVVGDGRHPLSVIPPLWAVWRGLWIVLLLQAAVLVLVLFTVPIAFGTAFVGLVVLTLLEGPTFERVELRLRGWREIAVAEARSEEGAEEAYRTGKAVMT
ncbi:MAG: hypothetical protein AAF416_05305 [Pseudomonadota bacterium]